MNTNFTFNFVTGIWCEKKFIIGTKNKINIDRYSTIQLHKNFLILKQIKKNCLKKNIINVIVTRYYKYPHLQKNNDVCRSNVFMYDLNSLYPSQKMYFDFSKCIWQLKQVSNVFFDEFGLYFVLYNKNKNFSIFNKNILSADELNYTVCVNNSLIKIKYFFNLTYSGEINCTKRTFYQKRLSFKILIQYYSWLKNILNRQIGNINFTLNKEVYIYFLFKYKKITTLKNMLPSNISFILILVFSYTQLLKISDKTKINNYVISIDSFVSKNLMYTSRNKIACARIVQFKYIYTFNKSVIKKLLRYK